MCLGRHARRDLETRHAALQPKLLTRAATLQAKGAPHDPALHRFLSTPISRAPCTACPIPYLFSHSPCRGLANNVAGASAPCWGACMVCLGLRVAIATAEVA